MLNHSKEVYLSAMAFIPGAQLPGLKHGETDNSTYVYMWVSIYVFL